MVFPVIRSLIRGRWWLGGLALGLALPAAAIVPALQVFPVEEGVEVRVWTVLTLMGAAGAFTVLSGLPMFLFVLYAELTR